MKYIIWKTWHEIADTVAKAFNGPTFDTQQISEAAIHGADCHIGYGILRGSCDVFKAAENAGVPWFNIDRGYFKPAHYDGYYRISMRGTQQTGFWPKPDYKRLAKLELPIKEWRGFDYSKPVLVCPPTEHVQHFFKAAFIYPKDCIIRLKGDPNPINFQDYNYVLTFNSSVGWQALQHGIPCVSDPRYSMVGSWFNNISLDDLAEKQYLGRNDLFATMAGMQFTLSEIEQGQAWGLIQNLISLSDTIAEKPLPAM